MGVKKSTVCIINLLSSKRMTAASSELSYPTTTRSSFSCAKLPRTWARSSGPILHAHPEPWDKVLNLICSFVFIKSCYLKKI